MHHSGAGSRPLFSQTFRGSADNGTLAHFAHRLSGAEIRAEDPKSIKIKSIGKGAEAAFWSGANPKGATLEARSALAN
jgi:hypothetical protein